MATYHCSVKAGAKGKAAAHAAYIAREGKYSAADRFEDLEATGQGNLPKWAEHDASYLWRASDEHERANGTAYREIVVALPRELTPEQRRDLVDDFVRQELGDRHAYQWAIHVPKAALDGGEQPHAHLMYCERQRDGIERDPEQYFKRYNAKVPERGGCKKAGSGKAAAERAAELVELRGRWATLQNEHLDRAGHAGRVDHRSLEAQGVERIPERHLGPKGVHRPADVAALLGRRVAEGELERAQREVVSLIDVSGDLRAALAERDQVQRPPAEVSQAQRDARQLGEVQRDVQQWVGAKVARIEPMALQRIERREARQALLVQAEPPKPTGLLASFKRGAYEQTLKGWRAQAEQAQKLTGQAQGLLLRVQKLDTGAKAQQLVTRHYPDLVQRVAAHRQEQARQEAQKDRERDKAREAQLRGIEAHLKALGPRISAYHYSQTLGNRYRGAIVMTTPEHVVQQIRPTIVVAHPVAAFGGEVPKVGQSVQLDYRDGRATVTGYEQGQSRGRGR